MGPLSDDELYGEALCMEAAEIFNIATEQVLPFTNNKAEQWPSIQETFISSLRDSTLNFTLNPNGH